MVQVIADEVVDVIAVRDALVAASLAVLVILRVRAAVVRWRAGGGVRSRDAERALVAVARVEMPFVQVVGVPALF